LTFRVDDRVVRTVNKVDTIDADGVAHYPTTPSSIQIRSTSSAIPFILILTLPL
jgi:hypothetical protein